MEYGAWGGHYYVYVMHSQVFVDYALSKFLPSLINVFYYSFISLQDAFLDSVIYVLICTAIIQILFKCRPDPVQFRDMNTSGIYPGILYIK